MDYFAITELQNAHHLRLSFPDCPGCETEVPSDAALATVAQRALVAWLEAALLRGNAPPRPRRKARLSGQQRLHRVSIPLQLSLKLSLRWSRQALGLSQAELAARLGVRQPQVARLERPGANVSLSTLERAFSAMGLSVSAQVHQRQTTS